MVRHYLLIKLKKSNDSRLIEKIINEFKTMSKEIDFIKDINYIENSYKREDNAELLIVITFNRIDDINKYINHKLHLGFISKYKDEILMKMTIDELIN